MVANSYCDFWHLHFYLAEEKKEIIEKPFVLRRNPQTNKKRKSGEAFGERKSSKRIKENRSHSRRRDNRTDR